MRRTTENRTEKPWAATRISHPSMTVQGLSFADLAGSRNPPTEESKPWQPTSILPNE